jgi:PiT family inorganic phosphate transporter
LSFFERQSVRSDLLAGLVFNGPAALKDALTPKRYNLGMDPLTIVALVFALGFAFTFECINGFHDTANAVATVIYTRTMPPSLAVVWSGLMNLTGVLVSNGAVAFGIVALLPVELVIHVGSGAGAAMVFAILASAIIWNLGTWYLGLPASSSHTLIGAIIGVGLANSLLTPGHVFGDGVNWSKVQDTVTALLLSPILGFVLAGGLFLLIKAVVKYPALFEAPPEDKAPPWPVRAILFLTCTGVSFAHGSNDGQKGQGLVLLVLVGIIPAFYALNPSVSPAQIAMLATASQSAQAVIMKHVPGNALPNAAQDANEAVISSYIKSGGVYKDAVWGAMADLNNKVAGAVENVTSFDGLESQQKKDIRVDMYLVSASIDKLAKGKKITDPDDLKTLKGEQKSLDVLTKFIPLWVKIAVAFALGLGTMVGWKRIVVTVGEKIGKAHLTYGQGASAEFVTYALIEAADQFGLPVSTTHILSSGIAGTMAANRSGLQGDTMRNILLAWVLTLPVCMFLGGGLFAAALLTLTRLLGMH